MNGFKDDSKSLKDQTTVDSREQRSVAHFWNAGRPFMLFVVANAVQHAIVLDIRIHQTLPFRGGVAMSSRAALKKSKGRSGGNFMLPS